jgi:hypothetical protein
MGLEDMYMKMERFLKGCLIKGRLKDKVLIIYRMVDWKENGKKMYRIIMVKSFGVMVLVIKVSTKMDLNMGKDDFRGLRKSIMKENFLRTKLKVLGFIIGLMEVYIRDIGLIFKWMVKESSFGLIKVDILEDIKMELSMEQESL